MRSGAAEQWPALRWAALSGGADRGGTRSALARSGVRGNVRADDDRAAEVVLESRGERTARMNSVAFNTLQSRGVVGWVITIHGLPSVVFNTERVAAKL